MEELAIKIEHVSKEYRLGTIGGGTLRGDLQSWWARKHGKEDPNSLIGTQQNAKSGDRFLALNDINIEVKKGEAVGIIGHNGAGKSTLLKLLSRVTAPSDGKISINGRIASMLEVGTGFHPELTGRENVYMNGAILGMTRAEIDKKFDEIVEFAEMKQFIDTPVKRYSSGMYVKLAFAVAAHLDSEIMVMDEVLAVGDMKFQQKCLGRMGDAANYEGRTVLYVSHNMNTIRQLCTRCIVLDHGRVIFDGDTETAIGIYMDKNSDMQLVNDCTGLRASKDIDLRLQIEKVIFPDKTEAPVYEGAEKVHFQIVYSAKSETENVSFRIVLQSPDKTRVGLATTSPVIHANEGPNELTLGMATDWLAPGKYNCHFVIYSVNEFGTERVHDRVDTACTFEKTLSADEINHMSWNSTWWGHMMIPELEII